MQSPSFQLLVDWDSDNALLVGDFEFGLDGWFPVWFGGAPPTVAQSTVRAYHGDTSLLVTWGGGSSAELVHAVVPNLVVGRSYTFSIRVWVPSAGGRHVIAAIGNVGFGSASSVTDQWVEISMTWTATLATHHVQVWALNPPAAGEQTWVDFARVIGANEDVSGAGRVHWDQEIGITLGRDKARALAPVSPGRTGFTLDNESKDYTPENSSSPLAGYLGPGRGVVLHATYAGKAYTLFRGHLDDYAVDPDPGQWLASFTALDGLARFKDLPVSTPLYPAVRTGQAVHYLLDAIGWAGPRDIDPGGSTLRWWWLESDDAFADLQNILAAEGPGALASIGPSGQFIFRDRHHRLIRDRSVTAQATFRDSGSTEPLIEQGLGYDIGWREIVNSVELHIAERAAGPLGTVWEDTSTVTVLPGESVPIAVEFDEPVWGVQAPTQGTDDAADPDILLIGATAVSAALSRTSGQSLLLTLSVAIGAGSPAQVRKVRLRGQPVTNARTLKVVRDDVESIRRTGGVKPYRLSSPWLNRHDGEAIADILLGQRASPLPTVTFRLTNVNVTTLTHQLQRDISDRIRATFTAIGMDADCYIETITYEISDGGIVLATVFGCEKIPTPPGNLFRFDMAGHGFDDGVFAPSGLDDPDTLFRFDVAGHGFDDGLFAT